MSKFFCSMKCYTQCDECAAVRSEPTMSQFASMDAMDLATLRLDIQKLIPAIVKAKRLVDAMRATTITSEDFHGLHEVGEAVAALEGALRDCAEYMQ